MRCNIIWPVWPRARRCIRCRKRDADLDGFLRSLALAWRAGEVRPTHQPRKRPPRHWCTRLDPFETTWPHVVEWLQAEPHRTALRPTATGAPRGVPPGPAPDAAAPRPRLAPSGGPPPHPRRSDRSAPACCCVTEHSHRHAQGRSGYGPTDPGQEIRLIQNTRLHGALA